MVALARDYVEYGYNTIAIWQDSVFIISLPLHHITTLEAKQLQSHKRCSICRSFFTHFCLNFVTAMNIMSIMSYHTGSRQGNTQVKNVKAYCSEITHKLRI